MAAGKVYRIKPTTYPNPGYRMARRRRGKKQNPRTAFRKAVQKIVNKNIETKQSYHIMAPTNFNSGIDAAADALRVLPNVGRGDDVSNRIGQLITAQRLRVQGAISWSPSAGQFGTFANARLGVRLFIIGVRQYNSVSDALANTATWMPILLQKGSTATAFTGAINDLWAPLNSESFIKYYDKVFYLDGTYQANATGMSQLIGATKLFKANLRVKNKVLKYETAGVNPTNYAPIFVVGYAHMDGSGADVLSTAITVQWDAVLDFDDA